MLFILWTVFCFIIQTCYRIQATNVQQKQHTLHNQSYTLQITPCPQITVQPGHDVTLCCEVSSLPESSTLQWEREGTPTANTTLFYNNTIFLLLYNVDQNSKGIYQCNLIYKGKVMMNATQLLDVSEYTNQKKYILYRESSNHSDVLLVCKSKKSYRRTMWIWRLKKSNVVMIEAEHGGKPKAHGPIEPGQWTTTVYKGSHFIFHISPVKFNYSGTYKCVMDDRVNYSTSVLHTLRVSAEPPGGVFRDQPVVLTCEVSEVTEQVTLAWLSMERGRGVLVKQEVLTKGGNMSLSVTVNSVCEEQVLWKCAVFTENKLRALVPITLHLLSTQTPPSGQSNHTSVPPKQGGRRLAEGAGLYAVVMVSCAITVGVAVLLLPLFFYCQRQSPAEMPSRPEPSHPDPTINHIHSVNRDGVRVAMVKPEGEELHYASVTIAGVCRGASGDFINSKIPDAVIYSTININ
ncbi:uncharacterized protein LOC113567591 [Electrophorus electricus]|uniref:uncharacterized protein LOC113567591 n=1 Tax=Electrophorus electricus TaxID=8005 RepID=UPI0015CFB83D|nr:uncharacterized protein LOC113567591 [Electrophorus electricus]